MTPRALVFSLVVASSCGFIAVVDDPTLADGGSAAGGAAGGSVLGGGSAGASAGGASAGGASSGGGSAADAGVCTPLSQRAEWPVKVVFVVQNSGGMCVVDPPGSTGTPGFCEQVGLATGATMPARTRVIREFLTANRARSNVSVAVVTWGLTPSVVPFGAPAALEPVVLGLQSQLVNGSNLQGALSATKRLVDMDLLQATEAQRARTRYVVVVLGTGVPYPRCASNDALALYANAARPELVWADSPGSGTYCNGPSPEPLGVVEFAPGGDLNQNTQLRQAVANLVGLGPVYHLGDVRLHTRLVLSAQSIQQCGPICGDVAGLPVAEARAVGTYTLRELSTVGAGTFADPGEPVNLDLSGIDTHELTEFCAP